MRFPITTGNGGRHERCRTTGAGISPTTNQCAEVACAGIADRLAGATLITAAVIFNAGGPDHTRTVETTIRTRRRRLPKDGRTRERHPAEQGSVPCLAQAPAGHERGNHAGPEPAGWRSGGPPRLSIYLSHRRYFFRRTIGFPSAGLPFRECLGVVWPRQRDHNESYHSGRRLGRGNPTCVRIPWWRSAASPIHYLHGYKVKEYFAFPHMSDVTFDMRENSVKEHQANAELWRVTLVETGEETLIGGRIKRILPHIGDDEAFCVTYAIGRSTWWRRSPRIRKVAGPDGNRAWAPQLGSAARNGARCAAICKDRRP